MKRPKVKICVAFYRPGGHVLMQGKGKAGTLDQFTFWIQKTGRKIEKLDLSEAFYEEHGREITASFNAAIQTLIEYRHE